MKQKFPYLLVLIFIAFSTQITNSQIVTDDVSAALNSGYSDGIVLHLNDNVELNIQNVDNVFNKQQTKTILSDFFKKNPPLKFQITHKGNKEKSQFFIGDLQTTDGNYRVSVLIKNDLIQQLRIENSDD